MRSDITPRAVLITLALCSLFFGPSIARGQDVGAEIGGGAGIFRPKNPEAKKRTAKPTTPVTKPGSTRTSNSRRTPSTAIDDHAEDLLAKGNDFRDARKYADAETSYRSVLQLKPRDERAAY